MGEQVPVFSQAIPEAAGVSGLVATPQWKSPTRIAFRFCFLYFSLYVLLTQMLPALLAPLGFVGLNFVNLDMTRPVRAAILWIGRHVFHVRHPIVAVLTGSGDKLYDWIDVACMLALAIAATALWSWFDRRRGSYEKLYPWFRLFVRFSLAATMLSYGAFKLIPNQMPYPGLNTLLERFGDFSPASVLWASVGAAPVYERIIGCAEMLGGILLIFPRTTLLGALLCLADVTEVFILNMTYDIPVKQFSFHLILMSLFLLAPDAKRLADVLLLNRTAAAARAWPLFRGVRANRIALAAQAIFGLSLIGAMLYGSALQYKVWGPPRKKPALYGVWNVEQFSVDGKARLALPTDTLRWRRFVVDYPGNVRVDGMDNQPAWYGFDADPKTGKMKLTVWNQKKPYGDFSFATPAPDKLILDGTMDGHTVHIELKLFDRSKFLLVSRGFHWVQDYPFYR